MIASQTALFDHPEGTLPAESAQPSHFFGEDPLHGKSFTIPHSADTTYLSHGYFRYIGKYPPQIVAYLMNEWGVDGPVLDPMCGGGTTLTEARLRGLPATGCDINPVSRLYSTIASTPLPPDQLANACAAFLEDLSDQINSDTGGAHHAVRLRFCKEYFSERTLGHLGVFISLANSQELEVRDFLMANLLSSLRRISRANIKKMNLEIDESRAVIPDLLPTIKSQLIDGVSINRDFYRQSPEGSIRVLDADAAETGQPDESYDAVFLHPPYLTNTAFSEFTQLQLSLLDINHKDIWKKELRCRGSFLHESNGLKKYLIKWNQVIAEAYRKVRRGGLVFSVVGDGQMDYVRIPIGAITQEFAKDMGFKVEDSFIHVLNNNTGRTQSRRMVGQHVAVLRKP